MTLRTALEKATFILFLTLVFLIPLNEKVVAVLMVTLFFLWMAYFLSTPWSDILPGWPSNRTLFLFTGIYVLYLLGMIYTSNVRDGIQSLQVKLPVLLFPLFFATTGIVPSERKQMEWIFGAFIGGNLIASLAGLVHACFRYFETHDPREFFYIRLLLDKHPSYISMYVALSIGMIIYVLMERRIKSMIWQSLAYILVLWFHCYLFLVSSKAGLLGLGLVILITSGYLLFVKKKVTASVILFAGWTGLFVLSLLLFHFPADRLNETKEVLEKRGKLDAGTRGSTASRLLIWQSSREVIRHHPWVGVGTGDVRDELIIEYGKRQFTYGINRRLNAHDQFLETWMAIGLPGLLLLMGYFIVPLIGCVKRKAYLYLLFLSVVGIHFLFESMLERQAGVVFYAFFNAFLFNTSRPSENVSKAFRPRTLIR